MQVNGAITVLVHLIFGTEKNVLHVTWRFNPDCYQRSSPKKIAAFAWNLALLVTRSTRSKTHVILKLVNIWEIKRKSHHFVNGSNVVPRIPNFTGTLNLVQQLLTPNGRRRCTPLMVLVRLRDGVQERIKHSHHQLGQFGRELVLQRIGENSSTCNKFKGGEDPYYLNRNGR